MKIKFVLITFVIILFAVDFGIGYYLGKKSHLVTVQINNISQKNIAAATIEHERGTVVLSDIKKKKSKKMKFHTKSENSYKLNVIFEDNISLYSEKRHVKPGSKIIESVTGKEIKAVL